MGIKASVILQSIPWPHHRFLGPSHFCVGEPIYCDQGKLCIIVSADKSTGGGCPCAIQRYCNETGRFIGENDFVPFINIFGNPSESKPEDSASMETDKTTAQESKPLDEGIKESSYPAPGAFERPEEHEQDHTPEKADSPLKEKEEPTTIRIPSYDVPVRGPHGWMV